MRTVDESSIHIVFNCFILSFVHKELVHFQLNFTRSSPTLESRTAAVQLDTALDTT